MSVLHLSASAASALADAAVDLIDAGSAAGTIKIYDGAMPATVDTAVSTQTLLAELTFADPAFGNASSGVATISSAATDSSADATGTATWARIADSDGNAIMDADVTGIGGGGTIELNTTSIVAGGEVSLVSMTVTMPSGA
jgi:hypothetical protein